MTEEKEFSHEELVAQLRELCCLLAPTEKRTLAIAADRLEKLEARVEELEAAADRLYSDASVSCDVDRHGRTRFYHIIDDTMHEFLSVYRKGLTT